MNKQQLVLVIARTNIDPKLIPPLQIIIPALSLISPFSLYTSMSQQINGQNLYEALIQNLKKTQGQSSLTKTLKLILQERKHNNFRVCILGGQKVSWDIVLQYKRKNVMIDTAASTLLLSQISYTTGGIAKEVNDSAIIREFLTIFSMSKQLRGYYSLQENKKINFHMECKCCSPPVVCREDFFICSVCLTVYCNKRVNSIAQCLVCHFKFDQTLSN